MDLRNLSIEKAALFLFGVVFLTAMLVIVVNYPYPSPAQWQVFSLTLALIAAGIGASLPGALHIKITPWIRAGGAIGLFVLVYLVKPASVVSHNPEDLSFQPNTSLALPVARKMINEIKNGEFETLYRSFSEATKEAVPESEFMELSRNTRQQFGSPTSTTLWRTDTSISYQPPRGHFRHYTYLSKFPNGAELQETVSLYAKPESKKWEPFTYNFNVLKNPSN